MSKQKLKDYLYSTIIPEGYNMSCVDFEDHHLDRLIELAKEAKEDLANNNEYLKLDLTYRDLCEVYQSTRLSDDAKAIMCEECRKKIMLLTHTSGWSTDLEIFLEELKIYLGLN